MSVNLLNFYFVASFFLVGSSSAWASHPLLEDGFFWKNRPELQRKIQEDREVLVSAQQQTYKKKEHWTLKSVGWVKSPAKKAFEYVQNFDRLKTKKDHFQRVEWDPSTKHLTLQFVSKFLPDTFVFRIEPVAREKDYQVSWKIIEGRYKDSEGFLQIQDLPKGGSEVALLGVYPESIPWYSAPVVKVGVEALLKHVALELRKDLENNAN